MELQTSDTSDRKVGDTREPIRPQILDPDGTSKDISGADSIRLVVQNRRNGNKIVDADIDPANQSTADLGDGTVEYELSDKEVSKPGVFNVMMTVVWPDGTQISAPAKGFGTLRIWRDIG